MGSRGVLSREQQGGTVYGGEEGGRYRKDEGNGTQVFQGEERLFLRPQPQETLVGRLTGPLPVCVVEA